MSQTEKQPSDRVEVTLRTGKGFEWLRASWEQVREMVGQLPEAIQGAVLQLWQRGQERARRDDQ